MKLPKARTTNILVQEIEKEVMIYDTLTDKAYCLNETSSIVFTACNGINTFEYLKSRHKLPEDIIYLALDGLQKENLLESKEYVSPFAGMNRREIVKKVGLASMVALPVISSLIAPQPIHAASRCTDIGYRQDVCASGQRCINGRCTACITSGNPVPSGTSCGFTFNVREACCSGNCYTDTSTNGSNRNKCV